jgi:type I restriction enzyme R subunit
MRILIDNYIEAYSPHKIGEFDDLTLLDFIKKEGESLIDESKSSDEKSGAAESIENNIRRKIVEKKTVNPKYYENMSEILEQLIKERNDSVISYKELLDKLIKLAKNVVTPKDNSHYPERIKNSGALQALYDLVDENEELAIKLHDAVLRSKMKGFREDQIKERRIKYALYNTLIESVIGIDDSSAEQQVEEIFNIVKQQVEY